MKVAVAISDEVLEREIIKQVRSEGHDLVKRCLDDHDIETLSGDVTIYADERFHLRHPRTVLINGSPEPSPRKTQTVGVLGVSSGVGVSTVALNLAVSLGATLIDCAPLPSIASMTGQQNGEWFGVELVTPPVPDLKSLLAAVTTKNSVIDLGVSPTAFCDRLLVVVAAHPISVERYLLRQRELGPHDVVLNKLDSGAVANTARRMLESSCVNISTIPRDDHSCEASFVAAQPIAVVAKRSPIVRALRPIAGLEAASRRSRFFK